MNFTAVFVIKFFYEKVFISVCLVRNMVHACTLCDRLFESLRGLNIHQAHCKFKQVVINRTNQDVIREDVFMNENTAEQTSAIVESEEIEIEIEVELKPNLPLYANASSVVKSTSNSLNGHEFVETIHRVYDDPCVGVLKINGNAINALK